MRIKSQGYILRTTGDSRRYIIAADLDFKDKIRQEESDKYGWDELFNEQYRTVPPRMLFLMLHVFLVFDCCMFSWFLIIACEVLVRHRVYLICPRKFMSSAIIFWQEWGFNFHFKLVNYRYSIFLVCSELELVINRWFMFKHVERQD